MSDPNAVSWSEHRTFSATFVGPTGLRETVYEKSLLEAKRDCEAAARAMVKGVVKK